MAKSKHSGEQGSGKVKFRVIEFELEGSDASMQESLKSIAVALSRGQSPASVPRTIKYVSPGSADTEGDGVEEDNMDVTGEVEEVASMPEKKTRVGRTQAKVVPVEALTDVLFDDVQPTFKEFAEEKNPPKDLSKYLVIAYWFKHHKKSPEISVRHFYTAYRLMGWKVPRDPTQPLRELCSTRDQRLSRGGASGFCCINQLGENAVDALGKE